MTFYDYAKTLKTDYPIMLAKTDNQLHELSDELISGKEIDFLTIKTKEGMDTYRRSVVFLMLKAIHDYVPYYKLQVLFPLDDSLYIEIESDKDTDEIIKIVKTAMKLFVEQDYVFEKQTIKTNEAIEFFKENNMVKKAKLFEFRRSSTVNVYTLAKYTNYMYGDLAYSTKDLTVFDLVPYQNGFLLLFPSYEKPNCISNIPEMEKVFGVLKESTNWAEMMEIRSIGDLNQAIIDKRIDDIILIQEALMEQKIANIAREIVAQNKKFVFIAGPSSSGKTSFSNRISVQLRSLGYNAHPIACDDYFKNNSEIPFDENGKQDFEAFDVVDIKSLEEDVAKLQNGEIIALPTFNFATGKREYRGKTLQLGANDIVVMEGIHCLNPQFLPNSNSYRIYVSALTPLSMDNHNRISSSDLRLMRRMARDARHRNINPTQTIQRWSSVRAGEEKNIFPYQENADIIFNTSFVYEIPVLKSTIEALLFSVDKNSEEYIEAKRLLKFLDFFLGYSDKNVPNNSLLREFIGGSCFNVG